MEPANESRPNTSKTPSAGGRLAALAGVAIVALLLGLLLEGQFGLLSLVLPGGEQSESTEERSDAAPAESEETEEESDIPDGFVRYTNSEIGFRIAYPEAWGEVETERTDGIAIDSDNNSTPAGHLLEGSFTQNDAVTFGSATYDFHMGTDAPLLVGNGYENFGGSYYEASLVLRRENGSESIRYGAISDQNPEPVSSDNGLIYDYVPLVGADTDPEPSGYNAVFNTEENRYNGVAFRLTSRDESARATFEQALETFELTEPERDS